MTKHVRSRIRYDGPALSEHRMDVQDLAPALLALADIVQIANRRFNGDAAKIRVLVDVDVEQKCFQLDVHLVQSIYGQAATFLGQKDVKTAKEIAEWIGLIGTPIGGLFALLKWLAGKDASAVQFTTGDQQGTTILNIAGSVETLVVSDQSVELARDPEVAKQTKAVLAPLRREGYDTFTVLNDSVQVTEVDQDEAAAIVATGPLDGETQPQEEVANITGFVRIKSAQYEGAAKWSLLWQGRTIAAEMKGAAADWVGRFQANEVDAPPNTKLDVLMTETVRLDEAGEAVGQATYQVWEIRDVVPPPKQASLDL